MFNCTDNGNSNWNIGLLFGGLVTWIAVTQAFKNRAKRIIREAENEAEVIKKEKMLQAKEKFLQLKAEHEKEINSRNAKILALENKTKQERLLLHSVLKSMPERKRNLIQYAKIWMLNLK